MLDNHTLYIFYFDLRFLKKEANMVVTVRFELTTSSMSCWHSNQLSYATIKNIISRYANNERNYTRKGV